MTSKQDKLILISLVLVLVKNLSVLIPLNFKISCAVAKFHC